MSQRTVGTHMPRHADVAFLHRVPVFTTLDDATLQALAAIMRRESHTRCDLVWGNGDSATALYIVERGLVALYDISSDGHEIILDIVQPLEVFGFVPFQARVLARDTLLALLPAPPVQHLMTLSPAVAKALY